LVPKSNGAFIKIYSIMVLIPISHGKMVVRHLLIAGEEDNNGRIVHG
jgi:hypothetical protein